MPRFIARPVVVEAHQWEGNSALLPDEFRLAMTFMADGSARVSGVSGLKVAQRGDWLLRGSDGQVVAMKAAAFEVAFEELPLEPPAERVKRPYNRKEPVNV